MNYDKGIDIRVGVTKFKHPALMKIIFKLTYMTW